MKNLPKIFDAWDSGQFVGNTRAQTRITAVPAWWLSTTNANYAGSPWGPFRWFQDAANDQTEVEIPAIKSVDIERSVDNDIATCTITMYNQWMYNNDEVSADPTVLGQPGYFSWGRGKSPESLARWNQTSNSWDDILLPDALLKTYQGYGGFNDDGSPMAIIDAVDDGYLTLTGLWLVDEVDIESQTGLITLKCRDMGKLLAVQMIYPPLVPANIYGSTGVNFYRWQTNTYQPAFDPRPPVVTGTVADVSPAYFTSSLDKWYGPNAESHGHRGSDSVDGNPNTFAWGPGNSGPDKPFATDYWEYEVNGKVNEIYMAPWAGNYTMYISVLEGGVWQSNGAGAIPYDPSILFSTQSPAVNTGANIPFISQQGVPWETPAWYSLGRVYDAQRIRITFRHLAQTDVGPWIYRGGIREVKMRVNTVTTEVSTVPWCYGCDTYNAGGPDDSGYWIVDDSGQVFAMGDARNHPKNDSWGVGPARVRRIKQTHTGQGYYTMQDDGRIHSYGDAVHYGDPITNGDVYGGWMDMAVTNTGAGYWVVANNGTVRAFGDAVHHGQPPYVETTNLDRFPDWYNHIANSICADPNGSGYWIIDSNGHIYNYGSAPFLGQPVNVAVLNHYESMTAVRCTPSGLGLYVLGASAIVFFCGDAVNEGYNQEHSSDGTLWQDFCELTWDMCISSSAQNGVGYLLLPADGGTNASGLSTRNAGSLMGNIFGPFPYFGGPAGGGQQRSPGNYLDYADIAKIFLAWAGWILYETDPPAPLDKSSMLAYSPDIFGTIEYTGAYSEDAIPPSEWDKKSVMDCLTVLKQIVGYNMWIDDEGGAHFQAPNWWSIGNFWQDGTQTDFIPEIDELLHILDYTLTFSDDPLRSEIIIATTDPTVGAGTSALLSSPGGSGGGDVAAPGPAVPGRLYASSGGSAAGGVLSTTFYPDTQNILRGIVKVAMWANGNFNTPQQQKIMAELIAMQIWFQQRIGQVKMPANPAIQINDQVRIYERTTGETYIHYVRGVSSTHDLETGEYLMQLTTHWLGDQDNWVITGDFVPGPISNKPGDPGRSVILTNPSNNRLGISPDLKQYLLTSKSPAIRTAVENDFGAAVVNTQNASTTPKTQSGPTGAADGS